MDTINNLQWCINRLASSDVLDRTMIDQLKQVDHILTALRGSQCLDANMLSSEVVRLLWDRQV